MYSFHESLGGFDVRHYETRRGPGNSQETATVPLDQFVMLVSRGIPEEVQESQEGGLDATAVHSR